MQRGRRPSPPVDPTDAEAAWEAALHRLARQPLPRAVLQQRLRQLGYTPETVAQVLARADEHGYLDDRAYAEAVVRRRARTRGAALIAQELRSKGFDDVQVAQALKQVDPAGEEARALALARSALRQRPPATARELRRRVGAVLGRRGFRTGTIVRTIALLRAEAAPSGAGTEPVEAPIDGEDT